MHGFLNASVLGYDCCIYVRYCYNNYSCTTSLVFWQSRITPIKTQDVPRLELQATLLLAKSMKNIYDCRVSEIRKLSNPLNWHHINSWSNPVDILSTGRLICEISKLDVWFCRTKFLCTKFHFDSVGQSNCFVDHADGSSQLRLLAGGRSAQGNYFLPNIIIR